MTRFFLFFILCLFTSLQLFAQADSTFTIYGKIVDEKTGQPIDAEVDIFFDSDFIVDDVKLTQHGEYSETLKRLGWYIIDIKAPGYLDKLDTLWLLDAHRKTIHRDYKLTPIEVGLTVVLDNLYFYFGKTLLKPDSYPALNQVAAFFKTNDQISFEIAGHTDDEGDEQYNLMLSEGRAKSVVDYLVKQGIDSTRLVARGYGETKPLDTGITKAAKARNRRVEFVVLEIASDAKTAQTKY